MSQSQSLNQLIDAADLISMLEDLTRPSSIQQVSPATMSGLRVTLRTIREMVVDSHDNLAKNFVDKARNDGAPRNSNGISSSVEYSRPASPSSTAAVLGASESSMQFKRKDLRTVIE